MVLLLYKSQAEKGGDEAVWEHLCYCAQAAYLQNKRLTRISFRSLGASRQNQTSQQRSQKHVLCMMHKGWDGPGI